MDVVAFYVENDSGVREKTEAPADMNLSVMEVLKASDYPVLATCGGMALCATCHLEVLQGAEKLHEPSDAELDMLDTLPNARPDSRLACQLRIDTALDGMVVKLLGEE
ncbi:2Fe-2S iron-sulfur cluster-binding protein [Roseivirga sp. BDSF3-8]|uniref:2Fe-2S iron-sulfur cluster-binding protein n=1 Tax=Roseivirga sp. BDSF3-8 TaxID=3241598 RepID=UPI0035318556